MFDCHSLVLGVEQLRPSAAQGCEEGAIDGRVFFGNVETGLVVADVGHDLAAVLLCLETAHRRNCLLDRAEEVFQALAESERGGSEDCLAMVK